MDQQTMKQETMDQQCKCRVCYGLRRKGVDLTSISYYQWHQKNVTQLNSMGIVRCSKFKYMVPIPDLHVGIVYGKRGSNIGKIEEKFNTNIEFKRADRICRHPVFIVYGENEINMWYTINYIQYIVEISKQNPNPNPNPNTNTNTNPKKFNEPEPEPVPGPGHEHEHMGHDTEIIYNNVHSRKSNEYSVKPKYNSNWFESYYMGCTCHVLCSCNFGGCCDDPTPDPCINCDIKDVHTEMLSLGNVEYKKWFDDMEVEYRKYIESDSMTRLEFKPFKVKDHRYPMILAEKELGRFCHCSSCRIIRRTHPSYKNTSFQHG